MNDVLTSIRTVDVAGSVLDGAMWEAWDQKAGMHPAAFLGSTPIFWLCDSGKSGFMFLRMFELTGGTDVDLMSRAVKAAEFLLRIQLPSGDFAGSVYGEDGKPVKPPNYAATTSAVLLWSKLYELTKNETWLIAAEAAAAATEKNYLQPDAIQINGGAETHFWTFFQLMNGMEHDHLPRQALD